MRYIIIILICISQIAICELKAQTVNQPGLRDYQNSAHELPDSILYIMSTDTSGSREGLGKWRRADSLVNSLGDHDFYGLNTNRPPFIGEDSIETALDTMYVLFKGLDGGLATKIEMLKNGVLQFDQAAGIADRYLINIKPLQDASNNVDFLMSQTTTHFSGSRNDNVFYMGWNIGTGGGVVESGKGAIGLSIEDFYNPAGTAAHSEFHLIHIDTLGVSRRPMTFFLNVGTTSTWSAGFSLPKIKFTDPDDINAPYFEFTNPNSGTQASMKMFNPVTSKGIELLCDPDNNNVQWANLSMSTPTLYSTQFTWVEQPKTRIIGDEGTPVEIVGRNADGWVAELGQGWGIDVSGGNLLVDSSQVATQYDLTTISGGSTDLSITQSGGTQVIQSSTGTDVGVRNLYGLLITEGATDTLHFRVDSSLIATQYDITQIPISSLKAAAATNTINNANYAQEWRWNTLAGTTGLKLSSTSTAAASNAQKLFEISLSGANASSGQSTYGGYFSNTHTGTSSTNYGAYGIATGAASANYGLYGTSNSSYTIGTSLGAGVSGRNSNGGIAIEGITTGGGIGVYAESPDGYASYSYTTNGTAAAVRNNWSTNSDYGSVLDIYRNTSNGSNGAAGIGGGIAFYTETSTGATPISNQIKSIWTTATHASRTSSMVFTGLNSGTEGDILTLKGTKQLQFHGYGTGGAFTASPVADLFVDASGNVVQGSMTGQSWLADGDDATAAALISNQTFKITGGGGYTGITTDLFDNAATDSIVIQVNGDKFNTVTTPEADDYVLLHDENGAGADENQKILWSDLASLSADGNGMWTASNDNTNIANLAFEVGVPGYLDFRDGSEHDLYIDAANDRIGMGTNSPNYGLHVKNDAGAAIEANAAGVNEVLKIEGTADGGGVVTAESSLLFNYTDADYAAGAEQQGLDMTLYKEADATQWTTLKMTMKEATDADAIVLEKNADFTGNTTESHVAINGGIAYTQNYDGSTAGADLNLDRSYYTINITGGNLTDTIKLPEVAYTTDNWNASLTSTQCQVGQEYVISNLRSGVNLVIGAYNPGGTSDDLIGTRTAPGGAAGSAISIAPGKSVIVKCYQLSGGIGYWNYWLSN